ncbi:M48 family metallopeptidase [Phycisphaerales bacterium AB-hyl4]|uniref:M48 family metallopeptidase n=1 Tax=Natronomicrosphaera hydrolytica TaxID=3242702 RepID=A0ABV4U2I0_9BACT
MQILLIVLILALFLHDAFPVMAVDAPRLAGLALLTVVTLPKLALFVGYWLLCRHMLGKLGKPGAQRAMVRLDRWGSLYRLAAVGLYGLDLYLGLLIAVRGLIGDLILLDELVVLLPTLALLIAAWWAYYPIERRIRESSLIGRLDAGMPIYPVWTRSQFVLAQVRHHMALVLVPLLLILTWTQTVERFTPPDWQLVGRDPTPLLVFFGAGCIFLLAPLIIRHVWDTVPLPAGELRDRLQAMCRQHRVGVRELLLWRTFGGMINAAVMGVFAPVRYILLTDALLEMVRREQVEAVMAHELAHVRRHHMFWLIAIALGMLGLFQLGFGLMFFTLAETLPTGDETTGPQLVMAGWTFGLLDILRTEEGVVGATLLATGLCWYLGFGWVSRRIERQADTFAVQHLAGNRAEPARDADGRVIVDHESAETMVGALQQVALLNHVPIHKKSWRHGSIGWRQDYLRSIVGQPVDRLSIDRQMFWINLTAATALLVVITLYILATALLP